MFWPLDTLWLAVGGAIAVAVLAALRPAQSGSRVLFFTMLCIASSLFCYSMGLIAPDHPTKLAWNKAEYATEPLVPGLIMVLALYHVRNQRWLRPLPLLALFCVPLFAIGANWTNDWHHLYYKSTSLGSTGVGTYLRRVRGPIFWLLHVYVLSILGLAAGLLLKHWRHAPRRQRRGSMAFFISAGLLFVLDSMHLFHFTMEQTLIMPYLGATALLGLLGWAMLRWRLLDLAPLSRSVLLEHMTEALLVLDKSGSVLDFNQKAIDWLGCSDSTYGKVIHEIPGLSQLRIDIPKPPALSLRVGSRLLRFIVAPFLDRRGKVAGWVLLGRDETREHEASLALRAAYTDCARALQQALTQAVRVQEEEQRRVGQDLHDSICQDLAGLTRSIDLLASLPHPPPADFQPRLQELARESSRILKATRTLAHDLALTDLGFLSFEDSLSAFAEHAEVWLGISVDLNLDDDVSIRDKEVSCLLLRIIREAVVNASRHGHAKKVWVAILKQNSNLLITISNDGLPLPPKDKVREGLGLRQMQMRARLLGGTLTLQNQPPNSVLLELVIPESLLLLPAEDRVREANISSIPRTTAPYARDTAT